MATQLEQIQSKAPGALCHECPLVDKPCAPSQGPTDAKVALVSRSPGYHEARAGKPFSGPSGKVLDHLLNLNGVKRDEILTTNVVLCAPDEGKVPGEAIKACSPRLQRELGGIDLIIAAGSEAVNLLIGRGSIDRYRGYRIRRGTKTLVATNNPALVLRDDSTFPNLVKDFKRAFNPLPKPVLPTVTVIDDVEEAKRAVDQLLREAPALVAADIESRGGIGKTAEMVCIQLSGSGHKALVFGIEPCTNEDWLANYLKPFLESDREWIFHNSAFDLKVLEYGYSIHIPRFHDTLLLSYVCDERPGVHALEYLLMEEFGWPDYEPQSVKNFKRTGILESKHELYRYAGMDAAGDYQLYEVLMERAKEQDVFELYSKRLLPARKMLNQMEMHGFVYDINKACDILEDEVIPELEDLIENFREVSDYTLANPRSPKQMSAIYYDDWGIKHEMLHRPDKKRSTDEAARKEIIEGRFTFTGEASLHLKGEHDKIDKIRSRIVASTESYDRYKKLDKQASNYLLGLIARAEQDLERRIYTHLLLHGTTSGRLSSRDPNLQNVTRTKDSLPNVRSLFRSSPGSQIVQSDYSQAELRCIAAFSGDSRLGEIYRTDLDLHDTVARWFYGENFTPEQRSRCKNMNFGVAYRQSAETFQEKHDIPTKEAQPFIDWWWKQFPSVATWELEIENEIRTNTRPGLNYTFLESPYGRRRRFYLLTPENIAGVYREGINFYPQTTASDFTLFSAVRLVGEIDSKRAVLALLVHDSILGDVEESYIDEYSTIVRQVMESQPNYDLGWTLPFKVDIKVGETWGDVS